MKRSALIAAVCILLAAPARAEPEPPIVTGPALLCFQLSSFSLTENERVIDFGGGIHAISVTIESPRGQFEIIESENFATPKLGPLLHHEGGTSIFPVRNKPRKYAAAGVTHYSNGESRAVVFLEGRAVRGTRSDASIYKRIQVGDPASLACDQTFKYGWETIFGPDKAE